jgi:hypothetical protein
VTFPMTYGVPESAAVDADAGADPELADADPELADVGGLDELPPDDEHAATRIPTSARDATAQERDARPRVRERRTPVRIDRNRDNEISFPRLVRRPSERRLRGASRLCASATHCRRSRIQPVPHAVACRTLCQNQCKLNSDSRSLSRAGYRFVVSALTRRARHRRPAAWGQRSARNSGFSSRTPPQNRSRPSKHASQDDRRHHD